MYRNDKHFNWLENFLTLRKIVKFRRKKINQIRHIIDSILDQTLNVDSNLQPIGARSILLIPTDLTISRESLRFSVSRLSRANARYNRLTAVPHIKIPSSSEILIDVVDVQRRDRGSIDRVCYRDHGDNRQITGSPTCRAIVCRNVARRELVGRFLSIFSSTSVSDRFDTPRHTMI